MDLDGVITAGTFWWDQNENEIKRFNFTDVTGIPLALKTGITLAIISGEISAAGKDIVERYSKKITTFSYFLVMILIICLKLLDFLCRLSTYGSFRNSKFLLLSIWAVFELFMFFILDSGSGACEKK